MQFKSILDVPDHVWVSAEFDSYDRDKRLLYKQGDNLFVMKVNGAPEIISVKVASTNKYYVNITSIDNITISADIRDPGKTQKAIYNLF